MHFELLIPSAIILAFFVATGYALRRPGAERRAHAPATPRQDMRDMVPAYSSALPTDASAGLLRLAFRAHTYWQNECPVVLLAWRDMVRAPMGESERLNALCELYSRAIFECCMARHLDNGSDPRSDVAVLQQIVESYGSTYAMRVHETCCVVGPVLRQPTLAGAREGSPVPSA